ncbi:tail fiber domain-containing protein [Longimicrobium sp.]|uniref:tail fiber domain-containing protein n=1 Tax=Longimicrobium sp. TaxID=2029185 RepID=UPI002E3325DD|nr:tail fiber domain-containing protein [Longimicrobium sp.]HEX6039540.1 tail fiber domain-containing protein [Longimicrobium sp.]
MKKILNSALVAGALVMGASAANAQTPDSAFAVSSGGQGLFRVNVDAGALFGGTYDGDPSGTGIPAEGSGTRMMWYPRKAAFRAGGINGTQWDAANIGDYSVAIGQDVRASASNAVAFGLRSTAAQVSSFAAGEDNTASGAASVALGYHAHTNARQGSFVFSDRSSVDTLRAGVNHSANWRVSGGFRIFTSSNLSTGVTIQSGASVSNWGQSNAVISTSTGAYLSTSGVWTNTSDVNRKHLFEPVAGEDVLTRLRAMPITSWSYRTDDDGIRHLGPTAQDFRAAFGLGSDDVTIGTVDADGVALAAAQALDARTAEQQRRIEALEAENAGLRARLERLEALVTAAPRN